MGIIAYVCYFEKLPFSKWFAQVYVETFGEEELISADYFSAWENNNFNHVIAKRKLLLFIFKLPEFLLHFLMAALNQLTARLIPNYQQGILSLSDADNTKERLFISLLITLRLIVVGPLMLTFSIMRCVTSPINHLWRPFILMLKSLYFEGLHGLLGPLSIRIRDDRAVSKIVIGYIIGFIICLSIFVILGVLSSGVLPGSLAFFGALGSAVPVIAGALSFLGNTIAVFLAQTLLIAGPIAAAIAIIPNIVPSIIDIFSIHKGGFSQEVYNIYQKLKDEPPEEFNRNNHNNRLNRSTYVSYCLFNTELHVPDKLTKERLLSLITRPEGARRNIIDGGLLRKNEIDELTDLISRNEASNAKLKQDLEHYIRNVGRVCNTDFMEGDALPSEPIRILLPDNTIMTYEYDVLFTWAQTLPEPMPHNPVENLIREPAFRNPLIGARFEYGLPQIDIEFIQHAREMLHRISDVRSDAKHGEAALFKSYAAASSPLIELTSFKTNHSDNAELEVEGDVSAPLLRSSFDAKL